MRSTGMNFHHLYYFWVVAKEGGMTRAAERLGVAVQTISSQLAQLEQHCGKSLMTMQGRRLTLTEAGRTAMTYADQIFLLGEQMQEALDSSDSGNRLHVNVGISDVLPKLLAFRLLQPLLNMGKPIRLTCHEGRYESLLADLALHKLDLVLTDRPPPPGGSLRLFGHSLGSYEITLFGTPDLVSKFAPGFPQSLDGAPMLMLTRNNTLRNRLDQWFESLGIRPDIVGEFQDSALLKTFGRSGLGMFPAPTNLVPDIEKQFGARPVGKIDSVQEEFYAISNERKIQHPALEAMLAATSAKPG